MVSDKIDEAIEALHSALALRRQAGDARGEAEGLYLLSNVLWCPGRVDEATEAARRAVDVLEGMQPSRELAMAYSRFAQLCMDAEDLDDALTWGARAIELAEQLGETDVRVDSLISVAIARWLSGDDAGRKELERCLVLARDAGLDDRVGRIEVNLVWVTRRRREYAEAYAYLEPALRSASELGMELWRGYLLAYRAQMELELGRWQEAVDSAALVLREPRRSRIPQLTALAVIGRVRARRGDPDVASPLDKALSLAARSAELQASEPVALARAEAAWLQGDRGGVEQATDAALALARTRQSPWVVAELAAWRKRAGIVDTLSTGEMAGPYALEVAGKWPQAAARWQQLGCPYEAALALAETDDRRAQRMAVAALQELGAKPEGDRRAAVARPRRAGLAARASCQDALEPGWSGHARDGSAGSARRGSAQRRHRRAPGRVGQDGGPSRFRDPAKARRADALRGGRGRVAPGPGGDRVSPGGPHPVVHAQHVEAGAAVGVPDLVARDVERRLRHGVVALAVAGLGVGRRR
jgi:hypothetical protein